METIEQQLHSEINSVQELLLMEAKSILEKKYTDEEIKTLEDLASLGFKQNKEYVAYKDWERAKKVTYYNEHYPMHKFITEEAVKTICGRYGLLLASVSDYKSDIPFENQKAIVNFRVNADDLDHYGSSIFATGGGISSLDWMSMYLRMPASSFILPSWDGATTQKIEIPEKKTNFKKASSLKIIAPPTKLNMEGKKIEGHCLIDKDPIVLQPVKDGYLIVTAWGFEAKDPEIKNPRHN